MRAFLSHSSKDKGFVERVAQNLRPGSFELDSLTFDKGGLNAQEISKALGRSDLFCLFLSKNSIASSYVDYEKIMSQELIASGEIKRILTICLDVESFSQFQGFAKHYNMVRKQIDPEGAARLIEGTMLSSHQERGEILHPFIGREQELKVLEDQTVDIDKPFVKALFVAGNAGSGRRTVSKKFVQNHYPHVRKILPQIFVGDFQGLDDIYRNVITTLRPSITVAELVEKATGFESSSDDEKAKIIAEELKELAENNETLIVYDGGGLLQDNGAFLPEIDLLVNKLVDRPHPPIIFVSPRMIPRRMRRAQNDIAYVSIGPLSSENSKRLLSRLIKEKQLSVSSDSIDELTKLADQHPFNIYRLIDLVSDTSADLFLANPIDFIEWKHKQTSEYLRTAKLTKLDAKILAVFSIAPELDFQTLCEVVGSESQEISGSIQKMIDLHVVRTEEDRISISPSLRVATERDPRIELSDQERSRIMLGLAETLSSRLEDENGPVALIDSTILATLESGRPTPKLMEAFILPSHRVWLAKMHYDAKRWKEAIRMASEALEGRGRLSNSGAISACRYIALAAARTNDQPQFSTALSHLADLAKDDWSKSNIQFLKGFNSRLQGDLRAARSCLLESYRLDPRNRSTARELASVCIGLDLPEEAEIYARQAYDYAKQNPFSIDILISCLVRNKKAACKTDPEVRQLLDILELLDQDEGRSFFLTRSAEIEYLYGDNRIALQLIEEALVKTPRLFDPLSLHAKILLKEGNPSKASDQIDLLSRILRSGPDTGTRPHHRQFLALKADYLIEIGKYSDAIAVFTDNRFFSEEDRADFKKRVDIVKAYKAR